MSEEVRARIKLREQQERRAELEKMARELFSSTAQYLAPGTVIRWRDEEPATDDLLAADWNGEPEAVRLRSRAWVEHCWSRCRGVILELASVESLEGLVPPSGALWADLHPVFVAYVGSAGDRSPLIKAASEVASIRDELGRHRHQVGSYFSWLASQVLSRTVRGGERLVTTGKGKKKARGHNRPKYSDRTDRRLVADWKASEMQKKEFERNRNIPQSSVRKAQDRIKARIKRGD